MRLSLWLSAGKKPVQGSSEFTLRIPYVSPQGPAKNKTLDNLKYFK